MVAARASSAARKVAEGSMLYFRVHVRAKIAGGNDHP